MSEAGESLVDETPEEEKERENAYMLEKEYEMLGLDDLVSNGEEKEPRRAHKAPQEEGQQTTIAMHNQTQREGKAIAGGPGCGEEDRLQTCDSSQENRLFKRQLFHIRHLLEGNARKALKGNLTPCPFNRQEEEAEKKRRKEGRDEVRMKQGGLRAGVRLAVK